MPKKIKAHKPPEAKMKEGRPSAAGRGYDADWRRLRLWFLRRHPLCSCGAGATVVDHIAPLTTGGARLDERNLQSLCSACHSKLTATHDGGFGRARRKKRPDTT